MFLALACGQWVKVDNGDGTYGYTVNTAHALPTFSLEQLKGDPLDVYYVDRAYGCRIDSFSLQASDGLVQMSMKIMALGVFQREKIVGSVTS